MGFGGTEKQGTDRVEVGKGREVGSQGVSLKRDGVIEGTDVHDIILDTGCSLTMIRQDLVPS